MFCWFSSGFRSFIFPHFRVFQRLASSSEVARTCCFIGIYNLRKESDSGFAFCFFCRNCYLLSYKSHLKKFGSKRKLLREENTEELNSRWHLQGEEQGQNEVGEDGNMLYEWKLPPVCRLELGVESFHIEPFHQDYIISFPKACKDDLQTHTGPSSIKFYPGFSNTPSAGIIWIIMDLIVNNFS